MQGIMPLWPAPTWVRAVTTLRPYNYALHVDDDPQKVALNRQQLMQQLHLKQSPVWLNQTHSNVVVELTPFKGGDSLINADGAFSSETQLACVVLTADCLPLLLSDTEGTVVAAIHCGWRGILAGIIENAVEAVSQKAKGEIIAWLGPAIGPSVYEIGEEVRQAFIQADPQSSYAFKATANTGKYLADMYRLVQMRLHNLGIYGIYGGGFCTYTEKDRFFSFRREGKTGRMATLIWLEA